MTERRRERFPERMLFYCFVAILVGFGILLTDFFGIGPAENIGGFNILIGSVLILFGLLFFSIFSMFGSFIWYDRRSMAKSIEEILKTSEILPKNRDAIPTPSYLLANAVDREALQVVSQVGGDLTQARIALESEALIRSAEDINTSMAKLIGLGLIYPPTGFPYYRVVLTYRGLEALNAPTSLFVSSIPDGVWQYVFQLKSKIQQGDWSGSAIALDNMLQSAFAFRLERASNETPDLFAAFLEEYPNRPKSLHKWPLGPLREGLNIVKIVTKDTFEDRLVGELIKLRKKIHTPEKGVDAQPFLAREGSLIDLYSDILLHLWFGQ